MQIDQLFLEQMGTRTTGVSLTPAYRDENSLPVTSAMMLDSNVDALVQLVLRTSDQFHTGTMAVSVPNVRDKIVQYLTAWKNLGKFEHPVNAFAVGQQVDALNREFVDAFAQKILPEDQTKVVSVVNPEDAYAYEPVTTVETVRSIPFYEKAVFRRLNDWHIDSGMDETEAPFYRMDLDPNLPDAERKKTERSQKLPSMKEREMPNYRMIPHY
jgi:hypothetical protein